MKIHDLYSITFQTLHKLNSYKLILLLLKPWGQFCLWPNEKKANKAVKKEKLNSYFVFFLSYMKVTAILQHISYVFNLVFWRYAIFCALDIQMFLFFATSNYWSQQLAVNFSSFIDYFCSIKKTFRSSYCVWGLIFIARWASLQVFWVTTLQWRMVWKGRAQVAEQKNHIFSHI